MKVILKYLFIGYMFSMQIYGNILQEAINKAQDGATLKLPDGIYNGNIVIDKPLTIIGSGSKAIIKGEGKGTVIKITTANVTLENLTIKGSGDRIENLDSAIMATKAHNIHIKHCKIVDSLYGIILEMVQNAVIEDNYITSKDIKISLRGNALKLWYVNNSLIKNNKIEKSKNITFTYSHNNKIYNNTFLYNMLTLHFEASNNNEIKNNIFKYNSVAIMVVGTKNNKIINNDILSSNGAAGIGVVLDKTSNLIFEDNRIKYNAKAIYIDTKRSEHGYQRFIKNNKITYNKEAIHFHASIKNNVIKNNTIKGNLDDIVKDTRGTYTAHNIIEYNYWDQYSGFDRDKDNIGDTAYQNFQYADQLWHYNHKLKFFYGSPIMSLINFLAHIAPFVEPIMLLEDKKPLMYDL